MKKPDQPRRSKPRHSPRQNPRRTPPEPPKTARQQRFTGKVRDWVHLGQKRAVEPKNRAAPENLGCQRFSQLPELRFRRSGVRSGHRRLGIRPRCAAQPHQVNRRLKTRPRLDSPPSAAPATVPRATKTQFGGQPRAGFFAPRPPTPGNPASVEPHSITISLFIC